MKYNQNLKDREVKADNYYSQNRQEMLEFIPQNSNRILDIGCGQANFSVILKKKSNAEVWGVEPNEKAALIAGTKLDKVIISSIEMSIAKLPNNYFDCLIFNDILEHLVDPYLILENLKNKLTADGVMVASIPNVRYFFNLKELMIDKNWRYRDAGILDKTQLRFFTKKSIIETLEVLDFKIIKIKGINPIKSWQFNLLNIMLLNYLNDTKYMQYACIFKINK